MKDMIIVRKVQNATEWGKSGYQVILHKDSGINKGETVLATLCGGNYGKSLLSSIVKHAIETHMIDKEDVIYSFTE